MTKSAGPFWLGVTLIIPGIFVIPFFWLFILATSHTSLIESLPGLLAGLLFGELMIGVGVSLVLEDAIYATSTILAFGSIHAAVTFYWYMVNGGGLAPSLVGFTIVVIGAVSSLYVRQ